MFKVNSEKYFVKKFIIIAHLSLSIVSINFLYSTSVTTFPLSFLFLVRGVSRTPSNIYDRNFVSKNLLKIFTKKSFIVDIWQGSK